MYMFKYVTKRLGLMIFTFMIIFVMCFTLIKLLPLNITWGPTDDPYVVHKQYEGRGWITNIRPGPNGTWLYDPVPIPVQLGNYLKNIFVKGDFGKGITLGGYINASVWETFVNKLPPTILINILSSLFGVPIGLGLGIFAALKKNKWQDQVINIFIILLISVPSIILGLLIQYFCFDNGLPFQVAKINEFKEFFQWENFVTLFPPVLALSLGSIAGYARYTRAELSEVLTGEFMLLARTKGLTKGQAIYRHAMRNSMVVIFPSILSEFIGVLSGSLIIEKMFTINGVGGLYLESINAQDYNFFMLLSAFYTLVSLTAGIVIDISYGFIDPRIRMGAK